MTGSLVPALLLLALLQQEPPRDRTGPWDGDIVLLESTSGKNFRKAGKLVDGGGVPNLIRDMDGRLVATFQWFPGRSHEDFDKIAVSFSKDDGKSWSDPKAIGISGFPEKMIRPCDPTLVQLDDGRFRLYFTSDTRSNRGGNRWASPSIHSAISGDAISFRYESGERFSVEGEWVIDCAVVKLAGRWHLYSPRRQKDGIGFHAVSEDGLRFERVDDVVVKTRGSWLGCAVAIEKGIRFYGTGGWSATSPDGSSWKLDRFVRGERGVDPGVARLSNGRWLMVSTAMDKGKRKQPPSRKKKSLRIFDLDLKPIEERDLVADIPGAAVRNQFWGLGTSQVKAGEYHGLLVHTPVGNMAKFSRGESIGARQIFLLRYDDDLNFVDAKGPLSETNRDNFWCTGSVWSDGRLYVVYTSLARGYCPGPGEKSQGPRSSNLRLGIFDENFEEIETVEITQPGRGGSWPGLFQDGNRLYVSYSGGGRSHVRELILD